MQPSPHRSGHFASLNSLIISGRLIAGRYPAEQSSIARSMAPRGYTLLTTPLDLHAPCDGLVRCYELVRRKIDLIASWLPEAAEVDILAGGTPHNKGKIPLLALHLQSSEEAGRSADDRLQNAIDHWFASQAPEALDTMLEEIEFPTWTYLLSVGIYPDRDPTRHGG